MSENKLAQILGSNEDKNYQNTGNRDNQHYKQQQQQSAKTNPFLQNQNQGSNITNQNKQKFAQQSRNPSNENGYGNNTYMSQINQGKNPNNYPVQQQQNGNQFFQGGQSVSSHPPSHHLQQGPPAQNVLNTQLMNQFSLQQSQQIQQQGSLSNSSHSYNNNYHKQGGFPPNNQFQQNKQQNDMQNQPNVHPKQNEDLIMKPEYSQVNPIHNEMKNEEQEFSQQDENQMGFFKPRFNNNNNKNFKQNNQNGYQKNNNHSPQVHHQGEGYHNKPYQQNNYQNYSKMNQKYQFQDQQPRRNYPPKFSQEFNPQFRMTNQFPGNPPSDVQGINPMNQQMYRFNNQQTFQRSPNNFNGGFQPIQHLSQLPPPPIQQPQQTFYNPPDNSIQNQYQTPLFNPQVSLNPSNPTQNTEVKLPNGYFDQEDIKKIIDQAFQERFDKIKDDLRLLIENLNIKDGDEKGQSKTTQAEKALIQSEEHPEIHVEVQELKNSDRQRIRTPKRNHRGQFQSNERSKSKESNSKEKSLDKTPSNQPTRKNAPGNQTTTKMCELSFCSDNIQG